MDETDVGLSELPNGWVWTTVGRIGLITNGKTPKGINDLDSEGKIPFYKVNDMNKLGNEKFMRTAEIALDDDEVKRLRIHVRRQGTVIFPKAGGAIATNKKRILSCPSAYDLNIMGVLPYIVPTDFFYQWLSSIDLATLSYGSNVPQINHKDIDQLPFPLPPLPEQHRIVAKIEELFTKLDAGIDTLHKVQAQLKRYRQSVLKAAFEGKLTTAWRAEHQDEIEPASVLLKRILKKRREKWEVEQLEQMKAKGIIPKDDKWKAKYKEPTPPDTSELPELPKGWSWATLPQFGELNRGKSKHRPRNAPVLYGGPYPFVQTGDIRHATGLIQHYNLTYSEEGLKQSRLWLAGTLCITIAANIADTAILGFDACFPDSMVGFLPEQGHCNIHFIEFFLRTAKEDLERYAPATAQKNINLAILRDLAIPFPPLAEQNALADEINRRLSVADEVEKTVTTELKRAEQLRQSILKKAFSGGLVPQDPNDEPASVLLERIRAEKS